MGSNFTIKQKTSHVEKRTIKMCCIFGLFKFKTCCFSCSLRAGTIISGILELILIAPPALILHYFDWIEKVYFDDENWMEMEPVYRIQIACKFINAFLAILGAILQLKWA